MSYQGYSNWDTWETWTILSNSQPSYKWLLAWNRNFQQKAKLGKFDMKKAEDVVRKYLIPVARGTRKPPFSDPYKEFAVDSDIDPKKVNKKEIVKSILKVF